MQREGRTASVAPDNLNIISTYRSINKKKRWRGPEKEMDMQHKRLIRILLYYYYYYYNSWYFFCGYDRVCVCVSSKCQSGRLIVSYVSFSRGGGGVVCRATTTITNCTFHRIRNERMFFFIVIFMFKKKTFFSVEGVFFMMTFFFVVFVCWLELRSFVSY